MYRENSDEIQRTNGYRRKGMKRVLSLKTKTPERFSFNFYFPERLLQHPLVAQPTADDIVIFSLRIRSSPPRTTLPQLSIVQKRKKSINYLYVLKYC